MLGVVREPEVEAQDVSTGDLEPLAPEAAAQLAREIAIHLDDEKGSSGGQQRLGQDAGARPDLDDVLVWLRRHGIHDAADDARVVKKMLPEALPRPVPAHQRCPVRRSTAARMMELAASAIVWGAYRWVKGTPKSTMKMESYTIKAFTGKDKHWAKWKEDSEAAFATVGIPDS